MDDGAETTAVVPSGRRRHLLAVGGAAAATVLVVAGVSAATARGGSGGSPDSAASAPRTVEVLDAAALTTLRTTLSSAVPAALAAHTEVVPLAPDAITPVDLAPDTEVMAAYAVVRDGDEREWRLFAAVDGTQGDPGDEDPCAASLPRLSCTVVDTADGTMTTQRFVSVRRTDAGPGRYAVVDPAQVQVAGLADLRVEQVVRLDLPGGGRISAWETVYGVAGADVAAVAHDDRVPAALVRTPELLAALTY